MNHHTADADEAIIGMSQQEASACGANLSKGPLNFDLLCGRP